MKLSSPAVRNIFMGGLLAGGLSFTAVTLDAMSCDEGTVCAAGTPLWGFRISCACEGPGTCGVITEGHQVQCMCDNFPLTNCDCVGGCS